MCQKMVVSVHLGPIVHGSTVVYGQVGCVESVYGINQGCGSSNI